MKIFIKWLVLWISVGITSVQILTFYIIICYPTFARIFKAIIFEDPRESWGSVCLRIFKCTVNLDIKAICECKAPQEKKMAINLESLLSMYLKYDLIFSIYDHIIVRSSELF